MRKIIYKTNSENYDIIPRVKVIELDDIKAEGILWSGEFSEVSCKVIKPGEQMECELNDGNDQFIMVISGEGKLVCGKNTGETDYEIIIDDDHLVCIPAGTWHCISNIENEELRLISIYAPAKL